MIDSSTMPAPKNVLSTMPIAASSLVRVQRQMSVTTPIAKQAGGQRAEREADQVAAAHDQKCDADAGQRGVREHVAHERPAAQHGKRADRAGRGARAGPCRASR